MKTLLRLSLGGSLLLLVILLLLSRCSFELPELPHDDLGQDGDIRVHMNWEFPGDVDLHVVQPNGEEIYFGHMESDHRGGGELDVDNIEGGPNSQENAFWRNPMPGHYRVFVVLYTASPSAPNGGQVRVRVKVNGEETVHNVRVSQERQEVEVREFDYHAPTNQQNTQSQ